MIDFFFERKFFKINKLFAIKLLNGLVLKAISVISVDLIFAIFKHS